MEAAEEAKEAEKTKAPQDSKACKATEGKTETEIEAGENPKETQVPENFSTEYPTRPSTHPSGTFCYDFSTGAKTRPRTFQYSIEACEAF